MNNEIISWHILLPNSPQEHDYHMDDEEHMSGQVMVGQAAPGTLASGNGNDNTDSQVVLGVANVHVDAVLL